MRDRIVVGVDGSDGARVALEWAVEEARLRGAPLVAVHTWQAPPLGMVAGSFDAPSTIDPELMKRVEAGAKQLLERELAAVDTSGIEVESLVEPATPPMRSSTQLATPGCSSSERAATAASKAFCWARSASRRPTTRPARL